MKNLLNLQTLIELVLLMHGIGMIGGIYFVLTQESWFSKVFVGANYLAAVIWLIAGVALIAAAWAIFKDLSWFKSAAIVAILANTIAVSLWYNGVPGGAIFGAIASDIALIYLLLVK